MGAFDHWATNLAAKLEDLEYVRLLVGDTSPTSAERLFSDQDLEVVCQREGDLKLAAAQLLDRIAGSELLLGKKITSQDLTTDGVAVAKELRALAQQLRDQYRQALADDAWGIATFQFADYPYRRPEATERWYS